MPFLFGNVSRPVAWFLEDGYRIAVRERKRILREQNGDGQTVRHVVVHVHVVRHVLEAAPAEGTVPAEVRIVREIEPVHAIDPLSEVLDERQAVR